jgi:hypothetical protein
LDYQLSFRESIRGQSVKFYMSNVLKYALLTLAVLLVVSCSSTSPKFTEYRSDNVMQGQGGSVQTIDGIEVWSDGAPNRQFKVIGIIDIAQNHGHGQTGRGLIGKVAQLTQSSPDEQSVDEQLVSETKAHGGDAIIMAQPGQTPDSLLSTESKTPTADSGSVGSEKKGHTTRAFVIKYVDIGK